ncbi:hypothetical protein OEV82_16005 [Caldibacillus thermolactis]|uniref:Uncharacterized protein n=1 Tax=Pallidibacillus thermolactis TaxID=251051 RepID=A0ABT2WKE3_9BACI|nr:hypothetical protein [Pallidibacillus thermolactis]MCU9595902.1 hypothetical protein [Pallidibacillus thermolactis]
MNTTVLKLENCKNALRRTYDKYMDNKSNNFDFNIYLSNEEYKESRLTIMKICKEKELEVPKIFKDCRSVEEFILLPRYLMFSLKLPKAVYTG